MTRYSRCAESGEADGPKGVVHWFALVCVFLAFALSGIVFSEPAPVDAMTIGLIFLLPVVGLTRITGGLIIYLALWLVVAAGHFVASANALDVDSAATFSGVSLYLFVGSFVLAAFVAYRPDRHTRLVLNGWTFAAVIATVLGIIGYVGAVPGAEALFTKFGRVSGSFKDPNVFGAFLSGPILYLLHLSITRPLRHAFTPLAIAGLLAVGVLLCFSRGAWVNLVCGVVIYGYLAFVTAPSHRQRARIATFVGIGALVGVAVIVAALQFDRVSSLLSERASLVQAYDSGHEGRFGGQAKAAWLIALNPLGIGANEFGTQHHHEEVHNVYLSVFLNGGWIGGGMYWILVALTICLGLRHLIRGGVGGAEKPPWAFDTRPLFLVVFAAFFATAVEGLIIDSDHWRHFYVLMGLCWGLMNAPGAGAGAAVAGGIRSGVRPVARAGRLARGQA